MIRIALLAGLAVLVTLPVEARGGGVLRSEPTVHPDHGVPFHEQLAGQWVIGSEGGIDRRLRFYDDGRFAFLGRGHWTAGSYFILRSDERSKGVLRLEYYLDGNLHIQEVRCEVHFEAHADHGGDDHPEGQDHGHGHEGDGNHHHGHQEMDGAHHHEMLKVESLPAAEQALEMDGDYERVH